MYVERRTVLYCWSAGPALCAGLLCGHVIGGFSCSSKHHRQVLPWERDAVVTVISSSARVFCVCYFFRRTHCHPSLPRVRTATISASLHTSGICIYMPALLYTLPLSPYTRQHLCTPVAISLYIPCTLCHCTPVSISVSISAHTRQHLCTPVATLYIPASAMHRI